MTTLYLIRHCEAESNRYRRCCGQYDCGITLRGERQVSALAERFADIPLDAVYASDLYRTRRTVQPLADRRGLPLRAFSGLREMHMGKWENRAWSELRREDPEGVDFFWNHFDKIDMRAGGGESIGGIAGRMTDNLGLLCRLHPNETLAIASHGMILRAFFHRVLGLGKEEINQIPLCPNTGVSRVRWNEGRFAIDYINDASHLDPGRTGLRPEELRPRGPSEPEELLFFGPAQPDELAVIRADCLAHGLSLDGGDRITAATAQDGTLAGYIALGPAGEEAAALRALVLLPPFRGRALSMQLMGEACAAAGQLGKRRLRVSLPGRLDEYVPYFIENGFAACPGEGGRVMERPVFAPSIL